jgi:hypothetical protein
MADRHVQETYNRDEGDGPPGKFYSTRYLQLAGVFLTLLVAAFSAFFTHAIDTTAYQQRMADRLDVLERQTTSAPPQQIIDNLAEHQRRLDRLEGEMTVIRSQHDEMIASMAEIQASLRTIREMLIQHEKETVHRAPP